MVEEGAGGLPLLCLHGEKGNCSVYPHGAHVASFCPAGGEELLWMSPYSAFEEGKPLRGGIPLCFPWFGKHRTRSDLPLHGLVRTRAWDIESTSLLHDGRISLSLTLGDDENSRTIWPFGFRLRFTVIVGKRLEMELKVMNRGKSALQFEEAFHTYLRVGDPAACEVLGLDGLGYIDRVKGDTRALQSGKARFEGEMVKAYMGVPALSELLDHSIGRRIRVEQDGMDALVLWSPGPAAGGANPENREAGNRLVCLETAKCLECPITLPPGESHRAIVRLSAEGI